MTKRSFGDGGIDERGDGIYRLRYRVAGRRWVTIRHADGVRTTYGPLDQISVTAGARVTRGQPIGTTADALTFTARIGEAYIDPASLFDGGPPRVRLVPEPLDLDGMTYQFAGDEHGRLLVEGGEVELGDKLRFIIPHCDPTVNLYDRFFCVRGDLVEDEWPIMERASGQTYF